MKKIQISNYTISLKNVINISVDCEIKEDIITDVVFFTIRNYEKQKGGITMSMNLLDLLALSQGIEELIAFYNNNKEYNLRYEKLSGTEKTHLKKLFLGYRKKEKKPVFYVNLSQADEIFSVGLDRYEIRAFKQLLIKIFEHAYDKINAIYMKYQDSTN